MLDLIQIHSLDELKTLVNELKMNAVKNKHEDEGVYFANLDEANEFNARPSTHEWVANEPTIQPIVLLIDKKPVAINLVLTVEVFPGLPERWHLSMSKIGIKKTRKS